jgi:hypothetical protein
MSLLSKLFGKKKNPEDYFTVTITDASVKIEHPGRKTEQVKWDDIVEIRMINTSAGPAMPDVWLALMGGPNGCLIPQGAKGFKEVYDKVSTYEGFDFDNVIKSMGCSEDAQFLLWKKPGTNIYKPI